MIRNSMRPFFAAILIQLNIGSLYAWNMISSALMEEYHFSAQLMGIVFGVTLLSFTGSMIPIGNNLHRFSPRVITLLATLFYGSGFVLSGLSGGLFPLILIGNGILVGAGTGIGYVSSMTYGIAPFQNKAIPTGIITTSFALGSVISAKAIYLLLDRGIEIGTILRSLGILQMVLMSCALFIYPKREPKLSDKISTETQKKESSEKPSWQTILPLWIGMFCATFGGLLVISNIRQIAGTLHNTCNTPLAITLFSLGNATGRILFGMLPLTKYAQTIAIIMSSFMLTLISMTFTGNLIQLYLIILLIGLQFGSFFVLFPMTVISQFGSHLFSKVYPTIFLAYGTAAAVGATLGGTLYDLFGSPRISLSIAGGIEFFGALLILFSQSQKKQIDRNHS